MIVDRRSFTNHVSFGKDRGEVLKHNIQVHLHEKLLTESNFGGFDKKKLKDQKIITLRTLYKEQEVLLKGNMINNVDEIFICKIMLEFKN